MKNFKFTLTITSEMIASLMTSFIDSGDPVTQSWVESVEPMKPKDFGEFWYSDPKFYEEYGFRVKVVTSDTEEYFFGAKKICDGFAKLAAIAPSRLAQILKGDHDAPAADILLQCVLFGEECYA